MKIRVTCPKCREATIVDDSEVAAGESGVCQIDCPQCQSSIKFRASAKPVPSALPQANSLPASTANQPMVAQSTAKPSTMEWSCGGCQSKLRVPTSAVGKSVRCPNCNEVGKVTSSESKPSSLVRKPQPKVVPPTSIPEPPKAKSSDDDWFSQLPSPLEQTSAPGQYSSPYAAPQVSPPAKQGFWGRMKEHYQRSKTQFGWHEPYYYAVALRGDAAIRVAVCAAVAFCLIGAFYGVTATNPTHPSFLPWAPIAFVVLTFLIFLLHLNSNWSRTAGRVSVNDQQIQLSIIMHGLGSVVLNKFTWRFDQLSSVQLVSSSSLGRSYSILVMPGPKERRVVCVPRRIDLGALIRFMNERGVNVVEVSRLPESICKPMDTSFASIAIAVMLCLGTVGFGFFGVNQVPQRAPGGNQVAGPDDKGFNPFNWNRPKKKTKLEEDTERFRARMREESRANMEAQERAINGATTFPPVESRFPPNMTPPPPSQGFSPFNAPAGNPRN